MTTPDYSTWLTKQQAADAIGVTTKSVERFVQAGSIQQARWQREGRGPRLAVYHPQDVDRIAQARRASPLPPFVVPGSDVPANGNGLHVRFTEDEQVFRAFGSIKPSEPGENLLQLLVASARKVMSETSQTMTLFVDLQEASLVTGLTQAYLRRKIADGTLKAEKDRGWKIRRKDLELL